MSTVWTPHSIQGMGGIGFQFCFIRREMPWISLLYWFGFYHFHVRCICSTPHVYFVCVILSIKKNNVFTI